MSLDLLDHKQNCFMFLVTDNGNEGGRDNWDQMDLGL